MIGPFSSVGPTADPPDREIFFIEPDLTAQALALIAGGRHRRRVAPAIVRGDDPALAAVADEAAIALGRVSSGSSRRGSSSAQEAGPEALDRLVAELARSKTDAVLYLGPSVVVEAAGPRGGSGLVASSVLQPDRPLGSRAGRPCRRPSKAGSSWRFPRLPDDLKGAGRIDLDRLRSRHGLSSRARGDPARRPDGLQGPGGGAAPLAASGLTRSGLDRGAGPTRGVRDRVLPPAHVRADPPDSAPTGPIS